MISRVKLPITDLVPFRAFQVRGYEAAILFATDKNGEEFFYNTAINCFLRHRKDGPMMFDFICEHTPWPYLQDVFFTHIQEFDSCDLISDSVISRVKHYLDQRIYVSGYFNEKFISHKNAYQKYDFEHSFLLYGYDNAEQQFYAIGYTNKGKFEFYTMSFQDFAKGFLGLEKTRFYLYYRNSNQMISLNLESLFYELEDYLRSDYTIHGAIGKHKDDYYGIHAMKALWFYVKISAYRGRGLDVRKSRFFFEHKEWMMKRLSYLHKKGFIKDYSEKYSLVVQKAKTMHLLFLKYNLTQKPEIIDSILRILKEANRLDEDVLFDVYDELKAQIKQEKKTRFLYG